MEPLGRSVRRQLLGANTHTDPEYNTSALGDRTPPAPDLPPAGQEYTAMITLKSIIYMYYISFNSSATKLIRLDKYQETQ